MSGALQLFLGGNPQVPPVDPYFYSVTSLLHGDGTNGAQNNTFLDSSTNNFTITRNGNTTQGSFSPFSQTGWSGYFDGTGDYISFTKQTTTSSFTCECWFYRGDDATNYHIIFSGNNLGSANADNVQLNVYNNGGVALVIGGAGVIAQTGTAVAKNQWNHIAWVRSGSSCAIFVNGFRIATGTNSSALNVVSIGTYLTGGYVPIGYISNARITTTAVYDVSQTTYTVPTAPFTAVTGTYLLTLQSNRFVDNSASPLTLTVNGNPSIQPFSPFNPITAYSTSAVGGSGYFDGSGDYLTFTPSSATVCPADFTLEMWFLLDLASDNYVAGQYGNRSVNGDWLIYINTSGGGTIFLAGDQSSPRISLASGTIKSGQWSHFALVRSGSTVTCYVNGVSAGTATKSTDFGVTDISYQIGSYFTSTLFCKGYIAGYRLVKGTAVYTGAFTPPTSPPTAISGTSLLLNFTNAGIFDNAAAADYETVGNTQISTSVKKYGTGSMAFDGTGDYLAAPFSRQWRLLNDNFTIEMWVYLSASQSNMGLVSSYTSNNGWLVRLDTSTIVFSYGTGSSATVVSNSASLSTGVWYHLAWCKIGSSLKAYVNGTQVGSTATISNPVDNSTTGLQVGRTHTVTNDFNGYIDDLRISKGVARYPYNFTPPTAEFPNIGGPFPILTADPYYEYTTLLLPGNGTNGAQNNTFLDSSTNAFSITRNGNTTQGTFSPFSQTGWGNFFRDGFADFLTTPSDAAFGMGTGAWTIEGWFYTSKPLDQFNVVWHIGTINATDGMAGSLGSNSVGFRSNGQTDISAAVAISNQWTHIAWVKNSNTVTIYVNGAAVVSGNYTNSIATGLMTIGYNSTGFRFGGYISNLRVIKGTAVYTANFTPPTSPLTAISGTSLLTCQANRFFDASSNNFTITRGGDTSIQAFSPFNPTAAWSAATNGGSGYFDGSGDYLRCSQNTNAAFSLGTGDFTFEAWVFPTVYGGSGTFIACQNQSNGSAGLSFGLYLTSAGLTGLLVGPSSGSYAVNITGTTVPLNAWTHVAVTRSGSNFTVWKNGVSDTTATSAVTISQDSSSGNLGGWNIGASPVTAQNITGYISDARLVKGTAVYTTAFTPPTAPLTAITNTSLLTNFTNAGIYDATSKNDLETVGNAQISTTQSKFGGSSMYFDGTGDYLTTPNKNLLNFGNGDFTIEGWFYKTGSQAMRPFGTFDASGTNASASVGMFINATSGLPQAWITVGSTFYYAIASTQAIPTNSWVHYAVVRYGGTLIQFVNGVQDGTVSVTTLSANNGSTNFSIGQDGLYVNANYQGYIDDFRITKGIARYTSNFTPPTTAFLTL